jgi:ferredoxin-type protein NapH
MPAARRLPRRQRVRRGMLLVSFLLLPVTLYYFSPAIILQAASEGVVNGSLLVFGLMTVASLFVGRLWCGWLCPAGGLQDCARPANNGRTSRRINWIKWAIWVPWIGGIAALAMSAGGYSRVEPLYQLETGVTMTLPVEGGGPPWYLIYYVVVALFLGVTLLVGRRAGCHTVCWMAPFMILGRKLRNAVRSPALRLAADPGLCRECGACTRNCPMSLEVQAMVKRGDMEDGECILCGTCIDGCPNNALRFTFGAGR